MILILKGMHQVKQDFRKCSISINFGLIPFDCYGNVVKTFVIFSRSIKVSICPFYLNPVLRIYLLLIYVVYFYEHKPSNSNSNGLSTLLKKQITANMLYRNIINPSIRRESVCEGNPYQSSAS